MRKRALSVLSAEKDHMQISFISENKPFFENASFVYNFFFYDCGVFEGSFARTKMSLSDFSFL